MPSQNVDCSNIGSKSRTIHSPTGNEMSNANSCQLIGSNSTRKKSPDINSDILMLIVIRYHPFVLIQVIGVTQDSMYHSPILQ